MEKTLTFQEIKELIRGAVSITQTPDGICMQRCGLHHSDPRWYLYAAVHRKTAARL